MNQAPHDDPRQAITWSSLLPLALFTLLTLLFFYRVIISGQVLRGSDFILSYNIFIKFALDYINQHNSIPYWLPYIYGGMPVVECLLVPFFYPPFWLLFFLPFALAMNLQYIIHICLAGFFTYLLSRELGVGRIGAMFSGIAYMFSGSVLTILAAGHYMKVYTYGLYPLLFLFVYKGLLTRRLFYFLAAGGVIGLLFLSLHMQVIYYGLMMLSFFIAYWLVTDYLREKDVSWLVRGTGYYLIMLLLGLGVGFAQFYPAYNYMDYSTRKKGVGYEFATSWSYPIEEIPGLFAPGFAGKKLKYFGRITFMDRTHYTSVLPLIFALIAIICIRRREVYFFTFGALFILTIALGKYTPLYRIYYQLIPGITKFRLPMSSLYLFAFFQALLAGLGIEWLREKENKFYFKPAIIIIGAMAIVLLFALGAYLFRASLGDYLVSLASASNMKYKWLSQHNAVLNLMFSIKALLYLGGVLLLCGSLFFLGSRTFYSRWQWFSVLLLLLLGADLFVANSNYIQPALADNQYYQEGFIWDYIKKDTDLFRIHRIDPYNLPRAIGAGNVVVYHKAFGTNGYYQNPIGRYQEIADAEDGVMNKNINFLALNNVKYLISAVPLKHEYFMKLPSSKKIHFYENKLFLPRFYLAHAYTVATDPKQIIPRISMLKESQLTNGVFFEKEPNFTPAFPKESQKESVNIIEYTANRIKLDVELSAPGFLTTSEVYYPAWEAEVDGKPTEILRANYFMRAIPVEAGRHQVTMRYNPRAVKTGLFITILSSLICLVALFITRKPPLTNES